MKVWTPGLHGFRSKHMHSQRSMIPPHIELCSISRSERSNRDERLQLTNRLVALCRSFSTFGYSLSELKWVEEGRALYLDPSPVEPFKELRRALQERLTIDNDHRETYPIRMTLAIDSDLGEYQLKEEFHLMNGDLLPLKFRATELELYAKRDDDWLLRETIPLRESEDN
jgi:hypothetical protein